MEFRTCQDLPAHSNFPAFSISDYLKPSSSSKKWCGHQSCCALFLLLQLLVTQSYVTLCDPKDCSTSSPSVHRILQARILEWGAISSSRGFSWPRRVLYHLGSLCTILQSILKLYSRIFLVCFYYVENLTFLTFYPVGTTVYLNL